MERRRPVLVATIAAIAIALALSGCGGDAEAASSPRVIDAGQVDIKLPPGFKVVNNTVVAPKRKASAAATTPTTAQDPRAAALGVTTTTSKDAVPIEDKTDATSDVMSAFGKFRSCLEDLGVKFIGGPNASDPNSPTNDPAYIDALTTCAARSNIVQAMEAASAEEENLTPAEIKERNEGYLVWRKCMIQRGWKIPMPTPDAKGRLVSFGGGGGDGGEGGGPQMEAPPGKDLMTSGDLEQCAEKATKKFESKQKSGG